MHGKKILVIDDDYSLCQMIKFSFNRAGAQVFTAHDGREGLHQFYNHRPDLVVLDVRMPDIDGWEACRQIRMLSNVPIIMLTTLDKDEEIIRGLNFGADDFVTKPFSREVLMARVLALLRRAETPVEIGSPSYRDNYLVIDLEKHLVSGQGAEVKDDTREKAREEARKKLEEELKKPADQRRAPEFGSDKDFQLVQAVNQLKGLPVVVSKTQVEREEEKKEN